MIEIIIKLSSKTKIWNFYLGHIFSWSCCSLTFLILHFEVYDILKCKNFLICFLDEFKHKFFFTFQNLKFFHILQQRTHRVCTLKNHNLGMQLVVLVCLTDRKYKLHALISFVREASDQYLRCRKKVKICTFWQFNIWLNS